MGKNLVDIEKQYKFYLKKRNYFLFFNIGFIVGSIGTFFFFLKIGVELNTLTAIYLPIVLVVLLFIIWYRQRYNYYIMQYEYYRMLRDNLGLIQLKKPIFTKSFLKQFVDDGFKEALSHPDFKLYYQFVPKIKSIVNSGQVLICIVLAKKNDFDFYGDELDQAIRNLYLNYKDEKSVKKQIVLQFKKYEVYNEESRDEINQIINFKVADNYLIHITIGYFYHENKIYFLRPKKRYPNKFYYFAVELIKKYTGLMQEVDNEKKSV